MYKGDQMLQHFDYKYDASTLQNNIHDGGSDMYDDGNYVNKFIIHSVWLIIPNLNKYLP